MPIAYCHLAPDLIKTVDFSSIVSAWASAIQVQESDITFNLIPVEQQVGQHFRIMIQLYLPTLWEPTQVRHIMEELGRLMQEHVPMKPDELFIHTHLVESGHVFTDGKIEEWG